VMRPVASAGRRARSRVLSRSTSSAAIAAMVGPRLLSCFLGSYSIQYLQLPARHHTMLYGRVIHIPAWLSVCGVSRSLFVHDQGGGKGRKLTPLLGLICYHETV
jgi:hypothetical protein